MKSTISIKKIFLLLGLMIFICDHSCEAQRWRKILDFPSPSGIKDLVMLPSGDIIGLVSSDSIILFAMDQQGVLKWKRNAGKGIGLVIELIDGYVMVGGTTGENFSGKSILIKLSSEGNVDWQKTYQSGFISAITKEGTGYLLGGNLDSPGSSSNSILYKVDSGGIVQWMSEYDVYSNSGVTKILNVGTELYLILDASTVGVGFEGTVLIKADKSTGQMIWRRDKALEYNDNFPDKNQFLRPMEVAMDAANNIVIAAPVNSSSGIIYSYSQDGELIKEVKLAKTLPHAIQILPNGEYLIAGILTETLDGTNAVIERLTPEGSVIWQRSIGQGSFFTMAMYGDTIIAGGANQDFRLQFEYTPYIVKMTSDSRVFDTRLIFEVSEDLNENCVKDITDQSLSNIILEIDHRLFSTSPDGEVIVDVDTGLYDYKVDLPPYLQLCATQQSVYVHTNDEMLTRNILAIRKECPDLNVGITYTEFIRGENSHFYVQYKNNGSIPVKDVVLNIKLDDRVHLENVSADYEVTDNGIQIRIPFLAPNFSDRVRIDLSIDENLLLFSTICLEASIEPHSTCNLSALQWNGPDLKLNTACENEKVVFHLKNEGTSMSAGTPYELFADGFRFEKGTIQLNAGEEKIFNIASGGNTISIRGKQIPGYPGNEVVAGSIEGCGDPSGEVSSLGMVRMFEEASPTTWTSRACIEVRDQYSSDRIMEIPRGLGRYHFIDSTQNRCEFSLMYQNETGSTIEKIELTISPGSQFDMLTFRECAASHGVNFELFSAGQIRIIGENLHLAPGDQFQYRFALDLIPSGAKDFISIEASAVINDTIPIDFFEGFYNRNKSGESIGVSPFVSIENGKIIGRGHTLEFDAALQVHQNGTVLYAGSTSEFGVDSRIFLLSMNSVNTVHWQHTYAFKEGGVNIRKIIPGGEGLFLLIGSIDDNQVTGNYINDAYAFMLMVDENGKEIWRRVWKPGIGTRLGGSLNNGHFYTEDKILLLGFRYTPDGARQFIIEIDKNGDIHWIRDFTLSSNAIGEPVTTINDIPMKVSSAGNVFIVTNNLGAYTYFVKLDAEAHILAIAKYEASEDMQSVNVKDFVILDNEEVLLVGDGYSYDADFNISVFGILIRMDDHFRLIEKKKILEESYYIELDNAILKDSTLFVAGAILIDSTSNSDAIILRSDLKGENAKILRIADFGARDYGTNVNVSPDGRVFAGVQTQTVDDFDNLQMGFFWVSDTVTATHDLIDKSNFIQIFPNPSMDIVNINSPEEIDKVNAVSMSGTIIQLKENSGNTYSVKGLSAGNYLLVIYTSKGTRFIAKMVKVE